MLSFENHSSFLLSETMKRLFFYASFIVHVSSLRIPFFSRQNSPQVSTSTAQQIFEWDQDQQQLSREKNETTLNTIHFIGRTLLSSEPIVIPKEMHSIKSFFERESTRNLIFSEQSNVRGIGNQGRIEVITTVASIQGLDISTKATIDTDLKLDTNVFPSLTFELVDSTLSATGAPPLVYLFEKLCSRKFKGTSVNESITTKSTTKISCQSIDSHHMAFIGDAIIKISIRVPEYLLQLMTIQDIEDQGCKAMTRYLENQVGPTLCRLRDSYTMETACSLETR
jgi:hypothetical protein